MNLNSVGMILTIAVAVLLLRRYRERPRRSRLPRYGTAGAALLIGSMVLNAIDVVPVEIFFTPLVWTGYILWADGAIYALRGRSLLHDQRREFAALAVCSIPLWLIFEAYNLRLQNWMYVGLPNLAVARLTGYGWGFATIWPGVLTTATLLRAMHWNAPEESAPAAASLPARRWQHIAGMAAGAVFLALPLMVPSPWGVYLFGAVWLGFILLLEPLNDWLGNESLWRDLRRGDASRLRALVWAGVICGLFWEFWNYSATARWIYTFPIFPEWRIFAMPVAGYLGFPAFALECFALYAFVAPHVHRWCGLPRAGGPGRSAALEL